MLVGRVSASAGDYEVAYAIEAYEIKESGRLTECTYAYLCHLPLRTDKIKIVIGFDSPEHRYAYVNISGEKGCCVFSDAAEKVRLNPRVDGQRMYRLPIFEGRERSGNEFVQNRLVGTLYLGFTSFH